MSESFSTLHYLIIQLSEPVRKALSETPYAPPEGSSVSVKAVLDHLLPENPSPPNPNVGDSEIRASIRDFTLASALPASSLSSTHDLLSWIPQHLSVSAESAIRELSRAYSVALHEANAKRIEKLGLNCGVVPDEERLVVELMPKVLPLLKDAIKESSIDKSDDEVSAASARSPVGFAIVAAYQFRWFVTQTDHPLLGKLCALVIPCALMALDHWSPEVKGQGMVSFIHIGKNVSADKLGCYQDVMLAARILLLVMRYGILWSRCLCFL